MPTVASQGARGDGARAYGVLVDGWVDGWRTGELVDR